MNYAPLVRAIVKRLLDAGYAVVPTPFKVATIEFAFTAALTGAETRSLDLVLIVDTTTGDFGDRDSQRVFQRIEALSRALDVTESRYVVTLILAGAVLAGKIERLSEICRVLSVNEVALDGNGMPANAQAAARMEDSIRVLLPLVIPEPSARNADPATGPMGELRAALIKKVDRNSLEGLIAAAEAGEESVMDKLAEEFKSALTLREPNE